MGSYTLTAPPELQMLGPVAQTLLCQLCPHLPVLPTESRQRGLGGSWAEPPLPQRLASPSLKALLRLPPRPLGAVQPQTTLRIRHHGPAQSQPSPGGQRSIHLPSAPARRGLQGTFPLGFDSLPKAPSHGRSSPQTRGQQPHSPDRGHTQGVTRAPRQGKQAHPRSRALPPGSFARTEARS